jgi:hypothetical protein
VRAHRRRRCRRTIQHVADQIIALAETILAITPFGADRPRTENLVGLPPDRPVHEDTVTIAHCWAHLRRQFFDLTKTAPAPIADAALRRIATLYKIEAEIRGRSAHERRTVRQKRSQPLVAELFTALTAVIKYIA